MVRSLCTSRAVNRGQLGRYDWVAVSQNHMKEATEVVPSVPSGNSLARQFKRVKPPSLGTDSTTSSTEKASGDEITVGSQ